MLVMVADITSAIGSEKKAASAVNRAGSRRSPVKKTHLRNAEQNSAWPTFPSAVVSSTSGYWIANGMIMAVNRLIEVTDRERITESVVNSRT